MLTVTLNYQFSLERNGYFCSVVISTVIYFTQDGKESVMFKS